MCNKHPKIAVEHSAEALSAEAHTPYATSIENGGGRHPKALFHSSEI